MKNSTKIIIAIVIVISLIVIGFLSYFLMLKMEENKVKSTVSEMFEKLKSTEDNNEKQEIINSLNQNNEEKNNSENSIDYTILFEKLEYSIVKSNVNFKEANVVIDITNKNIKTVIGKYISEAFRLALANSFTRTYTEEQLSNSLNTYLKEQMNSDEIENVSAQITLNMEKKEGKWVVKDENKTELINAILPGFVDAINQINNSFNSSAQ